MNALLNSKKRKCCLPGGERWALYNLPLANCARGMINLLFVKRQLWNTRQVKVRDFKGRMLACIRRYYWREASRHLLLKVEEPVEIYHDKAFKSRTFYFSNHNLTVAIIWAPFLVKSTVNEDDDGKSKLEIQLHLDVLEANWTTSYKKHDCVVISGGQWFLKTIVMWENGSAIGCHNCEEKNLKELGTDYPYHKALRLAFDFITSSDHKPFIFFRTWTPDHFEHGEWFNGGVCNRSQPYREGQFNGKPADNPKRKVELEEYKKAKLVALERGINMELVDVYHMSLLRPDGHPGPYRTYHPFDKNKSAIVQNDCLHWCLPGPVNAWNELVMKILYNSGVLNYSTTLYRKDTEGLGRISFQ